MTPIYKKTFDSPVLAELNQITKKDWILLKSIDITIEEYEELKSIFIDPEYNKDRFSTDHLNLLYNKVIITIEGQTIVEYKSNIEIDQTSKKSKFFLGYKNN